VSRWQLTLVDVDRNLTSPTYGLPRMFRVSDGSQETDIHPSRVVTFRCDPLPVDMVGVTTDDAFWGDSRLTQVFREVERADDTQGWFAALVKKAKLLRIGIPNIADFTATDEGQGKLNRRVQLIAQGETVLNATLFDAGNGAENSGEKISDYQVTWAGIPAVMDAFDQRVAAVADIPFTRLMGRSPAGMNATGQHDTDNWSKMVVSGQKLELAPCLDALDAALIPSAGVNPEQVTWAFAPLDTPSEAEQAATFKTTMEAVTALQNTGAIPDEAFAKGVQNLMSEREWVPGLDQALAEIPEDERFGIQQELDPNDPEADPSAIAPAKGGDPRAYAGGGAKRPAGRAVKDDGGAPTGDLPFLDGKRRSKAQRLAGHAAASHFDPTQPRDRSGRWIPTNRRQFIDAARSGKPEGHQLVVGQVSERAADRMRAIGLDGSGKAVSLDASALRHIHKRHGNEKRGGQQSVRGEDMASAAGVLNGARTMRKLAPAPTGAPRFATMTNSKGQRVYAVFEVRRNAVALHTMWVRG
jgi:hypothetical protein